MSARLLFHRDFRGYTGGHGKVWNYFNHALALGMDARVHLVPGSVRGEPNPWRACPERIEDDWSPAGADMLFVGGMDWQAVPAGLERRIPVVNLVQHVRHADPGLPLRGFLRRPALRICVGTAVADAILGTGEVAGPVRVIPAAIDIDAGAATRARGAAVFVDGLKNPALAAALAERLRADGREVDLSVAWQPRAAYLARLARARVAVPLPHATEGFYLPGLEAMALGCAVAMPPCVGSAEYARDGENCLMPEARVEALAGAVARLDDAALRDRLVAGGREASARHGLEAERAAFAQALAGFVAAADAR